MIGWPDATVKMLEIMNPSTISRARLVRPMLRELRFPDHVATTAGADRDRRAPTRLSVVGIDRRIGSVKGAELSGDLPAVLGFAQRVVARELHSVLMRLRNVKHQAVVQEFTSLQPVRIGPVAFTRLALV